MATFEKRAFDEVAAFLAGGADRHAILHLVNGAVMHCTRCTYSEVKDQGGGMRFRGVILQNERDPELQQANVLADAVVSIEMRESKNPAALP